MTRMTTNHESPTPRSYKQHEELTYYNNEWTNDDQREVLQPTWRINQPWLNWIQCQQSAGPWAIVHDMEITGVLYASIALNWIDCSHERQLLWTTWSHRAWTTGCPFFYHNNTFAPEGELHEMTLLWIFAPVSGWVHQQHQQNNNSYPGEAIILCWCYGLKSYYHGPESDYPFVWNLHHILSWRGNNTQWGYGLNKYHPFIMTKPSGQCQSDPPLLFCLGIMSR